MNEILIRRFSLIHICCSTLFQTPPSSSLLLSQAYQLFVNSNAVFLPSSWLWHTLIRWISLLSHSHFHSWIYSHVWNSTYICTYVSLNWRRLIRKNFLFNSFIATYICIYIEICTIATSSVMQIADNRLLLAVDFLCFPVYQYMYINQFYK